MIPVRTYAAYIAHGDGRARLRAQLRDRLRDGALRVLALTRSPTRTSGWIRFPYYHHVFDDERSGFARQLDWMRNVGEFLALDDAVALLQSGQPIPGRFFCLTFDDGFKNVLSNAAPILDRFGVKATVYVASAYVGLDPLRDRERLLGFYDHRQLLLEFLDWTDCRAWIAAGHAVGSHTHTHARLAALDEAGVSVELAGSKTAIEGETGRPCQHFCAPFGRPGIDYRSERDPDLARLAGYRSFASGRRGPMTAGGPVYDLSRDHLLANWGNHQLRYFLGD
ncbi:MAG: polysaccharide deacetylase family protein [Rhodospirillales bacterium]|nr:polysaccharide deacetylase family protein [Rhodospirillales bacterium]